VIDKKLLQSLPGLVIGRLPSRFPLAALLGPNYNLRCVLFHDVCDVVNAYTNGLGVTLSREEFEAKIQFLSKHYTPVTFDDVLNQSSAKQFPRNPVLVTFDDAYASVAEHAAPICRKHGIRPVFFVNAALVGNQDLGIDNLLCYLYGTKDISLINNVARGLFERPKEKTTLVKFIGEFLPTLSIKERATFRAALIDASGIPVKELASQAKLYVTPEQLRSLASDGFEIGSHTYSHVHCRILSAADFGQEIDRNKTALEAITGNPVRSFSVPYGSKRDLCNELVSHLRESGHLAAFLVESRANTPQTDLYGLNRVSIGSGSEPQIFCDIEILPRLRSLKDRFFGSDLTLDSLSCESF
jgi:peptidoglycan/xylan/chitin deacetylase (PgdA/CDA1 family)